MSATRLSKEDYLYLAEQMFKFYDLGKEEDVTEGDLHMDVYIQLTQRFVIEDDPFAEIVEKDVDSMTLKQVFKCLNTTSDPVMIQACTEFSRIIMDYEEKKDNDPL